jgi:preprotein translocase subunit SecG
MTFLYYTLLTVLMFVALLLILLILIQKGRGGGLSSAFGGGGGSAAFGAKTGDVLTWATSIVFGVFIVLAVLLDLVVRSQYKSAVVATTPPPASAAPLMPGPNPVDNTAPVPAPGAAAPVELPASNPVAQIQQMLQHATTQAATQLKSTTQP